MSGDYFENDLKSHNSSPITIVGLLTLLIILGTLIGLACIMLLAKGQGFAVESIYGQADATDLAGRNFIRWSALINHLSMFVLPGLLAVWFLFRHHWRRFLRTDRWPDLPNVALGTLLILCSMPLAQLAFWLNRQLPLPAWMHDMEDSTATMIENLLAVNSSGELLFNLLVIALVPAIGEELVFRGILQTSFERWFGKPHWAIWVVAILFSAFHMQFEGFLARVVLGAVLGYLFYWTRNLWVPIIAHFLNNALQILAQYFFQKELDPANLDTTELLPWSVTIVSVIFVIIISRRLIRHNRLPDHPSSSTDTAV